MRTISEHHGSGNRAVDGGRRHLHMNHPSVFSLALVCLMASLAAGTALAQEQQAPSENCHKYYFGPGDESLRIYLKEMSKDERRKCDNWVRQYERNQDAEEQAKQQIPLTEEMKQAMGKEFKKEFRKIEDDIEECIDSSQYLEHAVACVLMVFASNKMIDLE